MELLPQPGFLQNGRFYRADFAAENRITSYNVCYTKLLREADLGGHVLKKRVRFQGQGKRGSGRTIICFKKDDRAIFVHGFAKNEKSNISKKELVAFRRVAEILLNLSLDQISQSVTTGTFIEVATHEKISG